MKIAVVDDLKQDQDLIVEKIRNYMHTLTFNYMLSLFESGEQFLSALETERFDIVFMDIYMTGLSGLEAAHHLRKLDKDCKLIFLTCTLEFLRQGYAFNPCHYLVKPVNDSDFEQAMENCCIKPPVGVPFLNVISAGIPLHLDTQEIQYIDFSKRSTIIHTTKGDFMVSNGFGKVTEPLMVDKRFLLCIKGVLVNMDYITKAEGSIFLLKNGVGIPIAMRNQKNIVRQYNTYLFEQMGRRLKWSLSSEEGVAK